MIAGFPLSSQFSRQLYESPDLVEHLVVLVNPTIVAVVPETAKSFESLGTDMVSLKKGCLFF